MTRQLMPLVVEEVERSFLSMFERCSVEGEESMEYLLDEQ